MCAASSEGADPCLTGGSASGEIPVPHLEDRAPFRWFRHGSPSPVAIRQRIGRSFFVRSFFFFSQLLAAPMRINCGVWGRAPRLPTRKPDDSKIRLPNRPLLSIDAAWTYRDRHDQLETTLKTAIIIVDHGSRLSESNQMLEEIARRFALRFAGKYEIVEPAHMELAEPSIATAYAARGCPRGAARGRLPFLPRPRQALDPGHPAPSPPTRRRDSPIPPSTWRQRWASTT